MSDETRFSPDTGLHKENSMTWSDADDDRVRDMCKNADVGKMTMCPKCGMGDGGGLEMTFAHFCVHKYCPFRDWRFAKLEAEHPELKETQPRVVDDDSDEIKVTFRGRELRGWSYKDDAERRQKMLQAREYVEGWCDGRDER
jgi:hypothetical protein